MDYTTNQRMEFETTTYGLFDKMYLFMIAKFPIASDSIILVLPLKLSLAPIVV